MQELIGQLVSTLGVQEGQAKGGAGLLFQLAKDKLGDGEFSQLSSSLPGVDELLQAAPSLAGGGGGGGGGGLLSKVLSLFGNQTGGLGSLASLAGGFSQLGLDAGMVGQFLPIVLSFAQQQGGESVKNLLERALK